MTQIPKSIILRNELQTLKTVIPKKYIETIDHNTGKVSVYLNNGQTIVYDAQGCRLSKIGVLMRLNRLRSRDIKKIEGTINIIDSKTDKIKGPYNIYFIFDNSGEKTVVTHNVDESIFN